MLNVAAPVRPPSASSATHLTLHDLFDLDTKSSTSGPNVIKLFASAIWNVRNKLECLSLAGLPAYQIDVGNLV